MSSGANQALCAIFVAYSRQAFGVKLTLLRRFRNLYCVLFYVMFRLLRLKDVLITTVHSPKFAKLELNARARALVCDGKIPKSFELSMPYA